MESKYCDREGKKLENGFYASDNIYLIKIIDRDTFTVENHDGEMSLPNPEIFASKLVRLSCPKFNAQFILEKIAQVKKQQILS